MNTQNLLTILSPPCYNTTRTYSSVKCFFYDVFICYDQCLNSIGLLMYLILIKTMCGGRIFSHIPKFKQRLNTNIILFL